MYTIRSDCGGFARKSFDTVGWAYRKSISFFSGVPTMECCCDNDTLPKHAVAGLSPSCVNPDVDKLYISVDLCQSDIQGLPRRASDL